MIKSFFLLIIIFSTLNAQAYEISYKCVSLLPGYIDIDPVYISIDADASDRNNKIYMIAVDDSAWVRVETDNRDRYTDISLEIPSWGDEKFKIQLHNRILSVAYKGKILYKAESSLFPMVLNCKSSAGAHPGLRVIQ